ncbi:hypothetical protein BDP27DRAFT_1365818 [Rhodocollybia butyracea]|uniref:DUF6536 domain-containing protein n=1 Tax=Rhodocollybia butyracea TaxID=206335 RepID=A0A9P5PQM8_9AGAR|nr:hypothetical protein BDP27DRAFT_1365818 [Rhodocollybia butyracea]
MASVASAPVATRWSKTSYTLVSTSESTLREHTTSLYDYSKNLEKAPSPQQSWWRSKLKGFGPRLPTGWHFGVWVATSQAVSVLILNIAILIYTTVKTGGSSSGLLFEGDCLTVDHLNIRVHLVINILSTLLLGASNYVMQKHTESEVYKPLEASAVDFALRFLSPYTSSNSYNSSFFSTTSANAYQVIYAQGPDIQHIENNGTFDWKCAFPGNDTLHSITEVVPNWEFLSASDCLQSYAVDFLTDHGNVMVVGAFDPEMYTFKGLDKVGFDIAVIVEGGLIGGSSPPFNGFAPICQMMQCVAVLLTNIDPSNWTLGENFWNMNVTAGSQLIVPSAQVDYCLSSTASPRCQLRFNLPLLTIVVALNAIKVVCMAIVATKMKDHPLVTIGDAIASFIDNPSSETKGMCLVSQDQFKDSNKSHGANSSLIKYQPLNIRWMAMVSQRQWVLTAVLFCGAILITLSFLGYAISELNSVYDISGFSALWELGIGKVSSETIIQGWHIPATRYGALSAVVLLSNFPQLVLSAIYLVFNSLCTKLLLGLEWSSFAHSRKPLRVSDPCGDQRSTYFLQIPYRFGLPLMACSTLLHWLMSQSIFLVVVNVWDGADLQNTITSCGYSPIAMMLSSIVGASLFLSALAVGYFKHIDCRMPLVGSCSAAISAACHPPESGSDSSKTLMWGVVSHTADHADRAAGHISFSSGEVVEPVPCCHYS